MAGHKNLEILGFLFQVESNIVTFDHKQAHLEKPSRAEIKRPKGQKANSFLFMYQEMLCLLKRAFQENLE